MGELEDLKKQNKQLKKLLANAVDLLNRYKPVLEERAAKPKRQSVKAKKSLKK